MSLNTILAMFVATALCLIVFLSVLLSATMNRVDDLETRVNTFETVRIEYVVPDGDGA